MKKNKSIITKILLETSSLMLSLVPTIVSSSCFAFWGEEECPDHLMKEKSI